MRTGVNFVIGGLVVVVVSVGCPTSPMAAEKDGSGAARAARRTPQAGQRGRGRLPDNIYHFLTPGPGQVIVAAAADIDSGAAPLTVNLSAHVVGEKKNCQFTWSFGDGSAEAQGDSVSHTFEKPGMYKVALRASADDGTKGDAEVEIEVTGTAN